MTKRRLATAALITHHEIETAGSAQPNCATASFANQSTLIDPTADFIVNDATP